MIRRFEAIVMVPEVRRGLGGFWGARPLGAFRTPERARRAVRAWLDRHPVSETRGGRREMKPWGDVIDRRSGRVVLDEDARVLIVPSVGELGYW